ncbi:UNVERIFIED_ORG: hypothetical protein B2H95_05640 [Clostridium botulinum]
MEWIIKENSIGSRFRKDLNNNCQDKVYSIKDKESICIALADGSGSSIYGDIGAEIAVKTSCEYMINNFDDLFKMSEEKIKYEVLCAVIRALRKESVLKNYYIKDLSSTLSLVAIKCNKYISIFLGDGMIGKVKNSNLNCMFYFDSNKNNKNKYLTTTSYCYEVTEVDKGYCHDTNLFFILCDGVINCFYNQDKNKVCINLNEIIKKDYVDIDKKIDKKILQSSLLDDCSYIIAYKDENN